MAFMHNIVLVIAMIIIVTITIVISVCCRYHYDEKQKLYRTQQFVFSCFVTLLLCGVAVALFLQEGLTTAANWYDNILWITQGISKRFPSIWKLAFTLLGLFMTFTFLRPHLEINRIMVYIPRTKRLVIHVRNEGLFSVYNVSAKLYSVDESGTNKVIESLQLEETNQDKLEWRFAHSNQRDTEFCTKKGDQKIEDTLKRVAEKNVSLEIRVTADHAISRVRKTFVQQYEKNDILVGKFHNGSFKTIKGISPLRLGAYNTKQSLFASINKIITVVEFIMVSALCVFFAWYIGGKAPQCSNAPLVFDIGVIMLYLFELIRVWTGMPIKIPYDNQYSFTEYLAQPPMKEEYGILKNALLNIKDIINKIFTKDDEKK